MAQQDGYKKLYLQWATNTHRLGSPELDALIDSTSGTRQERAMAKGNYFTSSLERQNRTALDPDYFVVIDTSDKYLILEELNVSINYSEITDGSLSILVELFALDSNRSSFTVSGGTPTNIGVPLNTDFINKLSNAAFMFDSDVDVTGEADFTIYGSQYFRETSGNRETISGVQSSFFEGDRKLILSPNNRYIFRTITSGDASGAFNSLTQFSFTESETG